MSRIVITLDIPDIARGGKAVALCQEFYVLIFLKEIIMMH